MKQNPFTDTEKHRLVIMIKEEGKTYHTAFNTIMKERRENQKIINTQENKIIKYTNS